MLLGGEAISAVAFAHSYMYSKSLTTTTITLQFSVNISSELIHILQKGTSVNCRGRPDALFVVQCPANSIKHCWVFAAAKSIFAGTVEKNHGKTGNKFSTLNWMEILRCSYNASLKLR